MKRLEMDMEFTVLECRERNEVRVEMRKLVQIVLRC